MDKGGEQPAVIKYVAEDGKGYGVEAQQYAASSGIAPAIVASQARLSRSEARPLLGEPGCTRLPCDHPTFHVTISESEPYLYRLFEWLRLGLHLSNNLHDK